MSTSNARCRHTFHFALASSFSSRLYHGNENGAVYVLCYRQSVMNESSTMTPSDSNLYATFWIPYSGATVDFFGTSTSNVYKYYFQFRRPGVELTPKTFTTTSSSTQVTNTFYATGITGTFATGKKYMSLKEFEHVENPHYDTLQYTTPTATAPVQHYISTAGDAIGSLSAITITTSGGIGAITVPAGYDSYSDGGVMTDHELNGPQMLELLKKVTVGSSVYKWSQNDYALQPLTSLLSTATHIGSVQQNTGSIIYVILNSGQGAYPEENQGIGFIVSMPEVTTSSTYDYSSSKLVNWSKASSETGWMTGCAGDGTPAGYRRYMTCAQFSGATPNVISRRTGSNPYICQTEKSTTDAATTVATIFYQTPHQLSRSDLKPRNAYATINVKAYTPASYRDQVLFQFHASSQSGTIVAERIYDISGHTYSSTAKSFSDGYAGIRQLYVPNAYSASTLYITAYSRKMTSSTSTWTPWEKLLSASTSMSSSQTTIYAYLNTSSASAWTGTYNIRMNYTFPGGFPSNVSSATYTTKFTLLNRSQLLSSGVTANAGSLTVNSTAAGYTAYKTFTFQSNGDITAFTPEFMVNTFYGDNPAVPALSLTKTTTSRSQTIADTGPEYMPITFNCQISFSTGAYATDIANVYFQIRLDDYATSSLIATQTSNFWINEEDPGPWSRTVNFDVPYYACNSNLKLTVTYWNPETIIGHTPEATITFPSEPYINFNNTQCLPKSINLSFEVDPEWIYNPPY